jgi:hypothetical protein
MAVTLSCGDSGALGPPISVPARHSDAPFAAEVHSFLRLKLSANRPRVFAGIGIAFVEYLAAVNPVLEDQIERPTGEFLSPIFGAVGPHAALALDPGVGKLFPQRVNRLGREIAPVDLVSISLKELMLIEDAPPGAGYHYNMASALTTAANAVQGAYDEDPRECCESTWSNYGPDGVTKKGWITRKGAP